MDLFDFKNLMKLNLKCLYFVGLWPEGRAGFKLNYYSLQSLIFIGGFMTIHSIFRFMSIFSVISDLQAVAGIIFLICTEILTCIKAIIFIKNIQTLKQLTGVLNIKPNQPKSLKQRELYLYDVKLWRILSISLYSIAFFTLIKWASAPLSDLQSKNLPFTTWYPFDSKQKYFYEILYIHQTISFFFSFTVNVNIDAFVAYLMLYVGGQCEILCDNLKMLRWSTNFESNLLHCINQHKFTIKFSKTSNKTYNQIALCQFFTTSLAIGLSMFRLSLLNPLTSEGLALLLYIFGMTIQLFLYCWFGNQCETKSSQIPYAAFESDWTGVPIETKKNLLIFIIRAQRPIKMTAINLFSLSLSTFTAILRTSWSYFAVLRQVNAQD